MGRSWYDRSHPSPARGYFVKVEGTYKGWLILSRDGKYWAKKPGAEIDPRPSLAAIASAIDSLTGRL
jgi:hypothetical protein